MQETETVLSVIRDHPKLITGEPVMGKPIRRVREGADGKGPVLRAPHRRPTSLGKGPTEKDPNHGHLAGGLFHLTGGSWKRDITGHGHRSGTALRETAGT
jgi:hypothetical protein